METFKGNIGMPLELKAKENGIDIDGEIITENMIECGEFVRTMVRILQKNNIPTKEFCRKYGAYIDKWKHEIPYEKAKEIYDEFKSLLNE